MDSNRQGIVETYQYRKETERYSRSVSMCEIIDNDYNLNISRYVNIAKEEIPVNLAEVHKQLKKQKKILRLPKPNIIVFQKNWDYLRFNKRNNNVNNDEQNNPHRQWF